MTHEEEEELSIVPGCPECLVHDHLRIVHHGRGFVDNTTLISEELCTEVSTKAFLLEVLYHKDLPPTYRRVMGYGQVGMIRQEELPKSPGTLSRHFAVVPVTAKHNMRCINVPSDPHYPSEAKETVMTGARRGREGIGVNFDDLNWVPSNEDSIVLRELTRGEAKWSFGLDIAIGDKFSSRMTGVTDEDASFELVRPDFECESEMQVGIVVIFTIRPNAKTAASNPDFPLTDVDQDKLNKIYGEPNQANLYTGKITTVGTSHIEYDLNSFTSCSGAFVFLLDRNQPSSVKEEDYGKVIAVHAGSHPSIKNRNFGFMLTQKMLTPDVNDLGEQVGNLKVS